MPAMATAPILETATVIPRNKRAGKPISGRFRLPEASKSSKIRLASFSGGAYSSRSFVKNI
jgi:hypothetical protein